jgi:stage V sporulation protein G
MNITVERIYRLPENGPLKAFVDLSIDDVLLIKGIRIIQGPKGLFVSLPQEQGKDNRWYDSIRCLTPEFKKRLDDEIMAAYNTPESGA